MKLDHVSLCAQRKIFLTQCTLVVTDHGLALAWTLPRQSDKSDNYLAPSLH